MDRAIFRLVLLVSCAHALVHIYELTLPAVEQEIAAEYHPGAPHAGKQMTGLMSTSWRLPFGFGALLAGWLVDQFGSRRMLVLYLLGCSICCVVAWLGRPLGGLFASMFLMGAFASIYHPAGLALISLSTSPQNRGSALGLHGILGSIGISAAPLLVGLALANGISWRNFYGFLAIAGLVLATPIAIWARQPPEQAPQSAGGLAATRLDSAPAWLSFLLLTVLASIQGFVYAGVLSFLPRYLQGWQPGAAQYSAASSRYLAAGVLVIGCIGQYLGARLARPGRLESLLTIVTLGNVPMLMAMAVSAGSARVLAAAGFSVVHFMYQPIYNSLIAKYTPRGQRSLAYGFSFAMGFGIGGLGSTFAGFTNSQYLLYGSLSMASLVAGCVGAVLWRRHLGEEL